MSSENITNSQEDKTEEKKDNSKEHNFDQLRKKLEVQEQKSAQQEETIQKQNETLERMQNAFTDKEEPDEVDSYHEEDLVTQKQLDKKFDRLEAKFKKEFREETTEQVEASHKARYMERLEVKYPDYHDIVNNESANQLEKDDPDYAMLLGAVPDEYKRRELAYKRIQKMKASQESIQSTVNGNLQKNYGYTSQGQGNTANPMAFDFDVTNPEARKKAYAKLKAAQKRGL